MKKKTRIFIAAAVVIAAAAVILLYLNQTFHLKDRIWLNHYVNLVKEEGSNYYVTDNPKEVSFYNMDYQDTVARKLEKLKKESYSMENPLLVLNPFGTNTTGLYICFDAPEGSSLSYTVRVDEESIGDFSRSMKNASETGDRLEGQIIGLIQGMENTIMLELKDGTGNVIQEGEVKIQVPDFGTIKEPILEQTEGTSSAALTDGLFVLFGYDRRNEEEPRHLLFYDNDGVIRAEIPNNAKTTDVDLQTINGMMFFAYSASGYCMVDSIGQIQNKYQITGYTSHHDFDYDGDKTVVILADKKGEETEEDIILSLDLETGETTEILDFRTIMPDIYERSVLPEGEDLLDWIHFNTIDLVDGDDLILSSRELSTIIRINDVYTEPQLAYFIAEDQIWEGTAYEELALEKKGEFSSQGGQHTVTWLKEEGQPEGQYYLYMFNNNYGVSKTWPEFDYSVIEGIGLPDEDAEHSYYYKYLVDETAGTYELAESFAVPYSSIVSSVQHYDGNVVVCCGMDKSFGEYDGEGNLIAQFEMDVNLFTYRVFKKTMQDIWF